jgi:hypothetical protein
MNERSPRVEKKTASLKMLSQPWADLGKFALKLPTSSAFKLPIFPQFDTRQLFPALDAFHEFNTRWTNMFAGIQEQFRSFAPMLEEFAKNEARCNRLEEAGWLPHPASPWHLLDNEDLCGEALNEAVEAYYFENWPSVRISIEKAISDYTIDDEAKATFGEALAAHEAGLYRCVARTLFPEIERVSRAEIHDGAMDKIASQPKLQEAISNLCPSDIARDGISGMLLYNKLIDHLYVSMPTPERVNAIAAEPVPNRHAAVHGYVTYKTLRHSMNALIIAEYLFHAITVIMALDEQAEAIAEAA